MSTKYSKSYYERTRDKFQERQNRWIANNQEHLKEYRRKYNLDNNDRIKETSKKYYERKLMEAGKTRRIPLTVEERELREKESKKRWYERNKEKRLEYGRKYYNDNRETLLEKQKLKKYSDVTELKKRIRKKTHTLSVMLEKVVDIDSQILDMISILEKLKNNKIK